MDLSKLNDILGKGSEAVEMGANLESYNPLPALLWIFVFIVIALIVIIFALLRITSKSIKISEVNKDNIKEIMKQQQEYQKSLEKHNLDSISATSEFYKNMLDLNNNRRD